MADAARFFADRLAAGRMRLPDRYLILVADEPERARRLAERELARGAGERAAKAKLARYAPFAIEQRRYLDALAARFPGWITMLDATSPDLAPRAFELLRQPAPPVDGPAALAFAADWLLANPVG